MLEHLGQQLTALVEELRIVADPDAAEAQIESVTAEAAAHVAAATARTSRAEHAGRQAEAERLEADAAACEASDLAEQRQAALAVAQNELEDRAHTLDAVRAAAEAHGAQAQAELSELREQLAAVRTRLGEAEHDRDDATARAETASTAWAQADERARGAVARADDNAARAQRAEADLTKIRDERGHARIVHDTLREEASSLRGKLATAIAERDAARANIERERTHGDQRINDLHTTQDPQLAHLRDQAAELRQEVREQRGRADRAEARPTAQTDAAATKPAT